MALIGAVDIGAVRGEIQEPQYTTKKITRDGSAGVSVIVTGYSASESTLISKQAFASLSALNTALAQYKALVGGMYTWTLDTGESRAYVYIHKVVEMDKLATKISGTSNGWLLTCQWTVEDMNY